MAVVGVGANSYFSSEVGTIGTSHTFLKPQTINPPQNILAIPVLQKISESDDETFTHAFVSKFTNDGVTKTGTFIGASGAKVSFIEWAVTCDHSFNNPVRLVFFFG